MKPNDINRDDWGDADYKHHLHVRTRIAIVLWLLIAIVVLYAVVTSVQSAVS